MTENIAELVRKARVAQEQIEFSPQERVDEMVAAVGWQLYTRPRRSLRPFRR